MMGVMKGLRVKGTYGGMNSSGMSPGEGVI